MKFRSVLGGIFFIPLKFRKKNSSAAANLIPPKNIIFAFDGNKGSFQHGGQLVYPAKDRSDSELYETPD